MNNLNEILNSNKNGPQKAPFDVPEGYFETLEDRLVAQIEALEEKPNTRQTIIRILKPVIGLAASFLLILILVKYPLNKFTTQITNRQHVNIPTEDDNYMQEVLLNNPTFFDDKTLVQTITSDQSQSPESDELISILSSEMNDYEIFAELNN